MEIALCYPVPEAFEYAAKLGCRHGYLDICWPRIQPAREEFDFSYYDPVIEQAAAAGLELTAMVSSRRVTFPDGYWIWEGHRGMVPDEESWCRFLRVLVERYKETIRYWEVWSEPNCLACNPMGYYDPEAYLQVLKMAQRTIKETDATAKIVLGGIWLNELTRGYVETLLKKYKAAKYFDIFSWHFFLMTPYAGLTEFEKWREPLGKWVDFYRSLLPEDYPMWITEFGVPTRKKDSATLRTTTKGRIAGLSEEEQADWFSQFAEEAQKKWDIGMLVWVCLKDEFNEHAPLSFNDNLGMLREDRSEKPVRARVAEILAKNRRGAAPVAGGG